MTTGTVPFEWHEFDGQHWQPVSSQVIGEILLTLYVNGVELASIMSTPQEQDHLAIGFLKNERLIDSLAEVVSLYLTPAGCCVDIWLNHPFEKPARSVITSGCGGGVTFSDPALGIEPLQDDALIAPQLLLESFRRLQPPNSLYSRSRGVHAAGLLDVDTETLLVISEDVGRHNSIDKLTGACLLQGIETRGRILLNTGRISSEMLRKAAQMGCPIVASRTSPTSLSVEMARAWNITLVGYVRQGRMQVYSHPQRFKTE